MAVFLFVLVVFVVVGIAALAMRNRTERGIESGISSFRRELDALAPRGEPKAREAARPPSSRPTEETEDTDTESDDDEPETRTVQIGNKPPPRKLGPPAADEESPSSDTGDTSADTDDDSDTAPVADDAESTDDAESASGETTSPEADEEHADGS